MDTRLPPPLPHGGLCSLMPPPAKPTGHLSCWTPAPLSVTLWTVTLWLLVTAFQPPASVSCAVVPESPRRRDRLPLPSVPTKEGPGFSWVGLSADWGTRDLEDPLPGCEGAEVTQQGAGLRAAPQVRGLGHVEEGGTAARGSPGLSPPGWPAVKGASPPGSLPGRRGQMPHCWAFASSWSLPAPAPALCAFCPTSHQGSARRAEG